MSKFISDKSADGYIVYALIAWVVSCIHPALGMLLQFPIILTLVWKADIKTLPALLILVLGRGNVRFFQAYDYALRVGVTLTPSSMLIICVALFALYKIFSGKYDSKTLSFCLLWFSSVIPAVMMSYTAKIEGGGGVWSGPILDFLIPSLYYWGVSMGKTYVCGRNYLISRLTWIFFFLNLFTLIPIFYVFNFCQMTMLACFGLYYMFNSEMKNRRFFGLICLMLSFFTMFFSRYIIMSNSGVDIQGGDERGDTFSRMAVYAVGVMFSILFIKRIIPRFVMKILPLMMVCANIALISFVITMQNSVKAIETDFRYETIEERVKWKLFGDRATVWTMGWEDAKEPPLFFKNLEERINYGSDGQLGMRLLPHNQYLTLLATRGWWLGLVLSIFIIWIHMRMFSVCETSYDEFVWRVMIPVGAAVFCIVGTTGQAVVSLNLWASGFVAIVFPGIVYGEWIEKKQGCFSNCNLLYDRQDMFYNP